MAHATADMSILTGLYYFEVHILKSVNSQNNVPAPKQEEEGEEDDNKDSITKEKPTANNNDSPSSSTNKKGGIRIGLTSISALTQFNVSPLSESFISTYLSILSINYLRDYQ